MKIFPICREAPPPLTPPHKGEGDFVELAASGRPRVGSACTFPSPLWGGIRGGGAKRISTIGNIAP
jgi:hypothetical protein